MGSLLTSYHFLCLLFFFPLHFTSCLATHLCSHHEASSLIHFKSSFSINEIYSVFCYESYPKTNSWKEGTDCCSWDGVTCDYVTGHVIALDLSCSWLSGNFPPNSTLFNLPYLQNLNLAFNSFEGKVPSQVSHLSKLASLDLSNSFNEIDKHSLEGLVHNLTEVAYLILDSIDMSSITLNVFMNLSSSLRSLSLRGCDLRGNFSKNIFDLPNLRLLDLGFNQNLSLDLLKFNRNNNLEGMDLSMMSLSRELIDSIDNLHALKYLSLFGSDLWGSIPRFLSNLLRLTHLDLAANYLSGPIPSSITNLTQLEFLDIRDNFVEGSIPDEVTAFPNLIYLGLSNNLLNGTLPSWLYTVSSLQSIWLDDNKFSGHIKEFQSKSLQDIYLRNNTLQGPIPSSILQLPNLTILSLSHNYNLSLTSNDTARADHILPNLRVLFLSSCNVNEFPKFLKGSTSLMRLDLSNNKIVGKIPKWMEEIVKDYSLSYLNLSSNSLTEVGRLPCNAGSLDVLDLSHNNLTGTLPPCIGNLSKSLSFLNLKKNRLNGNIPPTFAKGCQLNYLNLNGNQFEGPLTTSIRNCRALEVLDVGNNNINDTFPHWLGTLPHLQVLVLKSNQMHGSLHLVRSRSSNFFSKIQMFDMSSNYFTGSLPVRYIKNFKAIANLEKNGSARQYMGVHDRGDDEFYSYSIGIGIKGQDRELEKIFTMWTIIDLSNNEFEGGIPKVIGKLSFLKGLNLSHNNLSGSIPPSIGNLTNLEWLDLSSNKLVGKIPGQVLDLISLSVLNLSNNELVGCIPRGKQFNTFESTSYEGNKGLRGFPLSGDCNNNEPPPPALPPSKLPEEDGSKSDLAFGWKAVLLGYGCGVVLGLSMGYVVFQTGKPKWIVNQVEDYLHKRRSRKPKIAYRKTMEEEGSS